ncbi:acyl-CoA thioesterase [Acidithiobacillus thiooxidans]|uniref:Thioesterase domain-containing protein n=1 Tax=Acidithiobacillus thiooxidans TaxID=930 RepID=A0A1C2JE21_ACITH|nr:acyl-CoA thioesterase [Acidithiobacillus thiooxidans]OCX73681.1 hypothetical protein A6M23_07750 [Acidithiobacillus thiooxidans]OCX86414.1 hypothetical protein A6P08_06115 [Acidithiobacillus thiooxidans]
MDKSHWLREVTCLVPLRPNDFDWSHQLNNAVYPQLLESGRWAWALENCIDLRMDGLLGVVSRLELDYLKPVFWDPISTVKVHTGVRNVQRFSIYLNQMVEDPESQTCARACVQLALYDSVKKVPVAIDLEKFRRSSA